MKILATAAVLKFECLKADCPDTCCKGWGMQVDDATFEKYKQQGLENAVVVENENRVMRRHPETDYCVKFTDGLCGIQNTKGADMLGDACNFYPRVTRKFGDDILMTATLSCPEIVRLSLFEESAGIGETVADRLPQNLVNYEGSLQTHKAFLEACTANDSAAKIMARVYIAANSLQYIKPEDWAEATPIMLKMADGRMPAPETYTNDALNILQIFAAVLYATRKKINPRLQEILQQMEISLGAKINWESLEIETINKDDLHKTLQRKNDYDDLLKKFLAAQMSFSTFPFAGLGNDIVEKARMLAFRFALTRLALMCFESPSQEKTIQIIQSIARIIDHLGDATLTLNLMNQFGFDKDARVIGLITQ